MREIETITSRENSRLINVRRIRNGGESEQIFIEGRRLVGEALLSDLVFEECFIADSFGRDSLIEKIARRNTAVYEVSEKIFRSLADTDEPQGIIVIARRPQTFASHIESRLAVASLPIVLFVHEINNPSNLGAVIRTAEAAGIAGVIISPNSAKVFSPKAIRAAMGASFRLPIWNAVEYEAVLKWAKTQNLKTTASDISATTDYVDADWLVPRLLIIGSEAHGLSITNLKMADDVIKIPMANNVESLNLAVSVGILLFEAKRQNS